MDSTKTPIKDGLIQQLNPQIGFNVNSIQRQIQPLNPQMGFNMNSIQRQI